MPRRSLPLLLLVLGLLPLTALPAAAAPDYEDVVDITFPVDGEVTYSNDYHAGRSRGAHGSTDLGGPDTYGLPVHAAVGGTVTYLTGADGNPPHYGYMITIAGDDGREYSYLHLGRQNGPRSEAYVSGLQRGSRVARGEHIGYVGHSGNASASWPHLHFEIHDDAVRDPYGDARRNPYQSLRAAERRGDYPGSTGPFRDVSSNHLYAADIETLVERGLTRGCDSGRYCPEESVTRGQLATFLEEAMGLSFSGTPPFSDVDAGHPHATGIGATAEAEISRGFTDGTFRPRAPIRRDQLASLLAGALELDTDVPPSDFPDVAADSVHAGAVAAIADEGITQGDENGRFRPAEPVSRGQMAAFLVRAFPE